MNSLPRLIFFATIFITGAAVLIFEVAAVRALSPYFGASIYVISSVLTVILAALSLGYYFGGRLADRRPEPGVLYIIIGMSGLVMNGLFYLSLHLFPIAGSVLPITFGPLILAAVFFLMPAFLLGIDSPFVIKLLTTNDTEHNGAVVGSTFFWSTIGSIVGSLISGFVLIPYLGLDYTFVGTATFLSFISLCAAWVIRRHSQLQFHSHSTR
jgi:Predicted spermidine synthase with an N-terminal membrane domain